jgi:hypothetical protein
MGGEIRVQFNGQQVGCPGGKGTGDRSHTGADLDHGATGEIAQRSCDSLDGFCVVKEVLSELWF